MVSWSAADSGASRILKNPYSPPVRLNESDGLVEMTSEMTPMLEVGMEAECSIGSLEVVLLKGLLRSLLVEGILSHDGTATPQVPEVLEELSREGDVVLSVVNEADVEGGYVWEVIVVGFKGGLVDNGEVDNGGAGNVVTGTKDESSLFDMCANSSVLSTGSTAL